jgi:hypothetical protein
MDNFFEAEGVINLLVQKGIIKPTEWKRTHPDAKNYSISFDRQNGPGIIMLEICKKDGVYYISKSRLNILSQRYGFSIDL